MIYETFREAIQNIWSNKFRTFLTMLGIIIGVMAVMVIVGLGNGMTTSIQNEFADMGTNLLTVQVMGYGSRSVKVKDFYELVEKNSDVLGDVSPVISMSGTVKVGTDDDSYSSTSVKGVSEVYLNMDGYTIAQGRPLNYVDMDANKKVCMVGDYISRVGYGGNAIGQCWKPRSTTPPIRRAAATTAFLCPTLRPCVSLASARPVLTRSLCPMRRISPRARPSLRMACRSCFTRTAAIWSSA